MESNKRRQILYRTHYKNHKEVSLSVSGVNNSVSKQASNLTDEKTFIVSKCYDVIQNKGIAQSAPAQVDYQF